VADTTGIRFRIMGAPPPGQLARYAGRDTFFIGRNRFRFVRESGKVTAMRADLITVVTTLSRIPWNGR
jgi:hypothetical protein